MAWGWLARLVRAVLPGPFRTGGQSQAGVADDDLGRLSERQARAFLERAGFSIVAANYRCPLGELDLVAEERGRLVFVEVKARRLIDSPDGSPRPEAAVDRRKQKRIGLVAKHFCRTRRWDGRPVRFDVIALDWPDSGEPIIRHHPAAFRPDV